MPEQRRRFSPRFKAEAVQMVIETGRPIAEVARDLAIHDGTLGTWVDAWRRAHPDPDEPLTPVERGRVTELAVVASRLVTRFSSSVPAGGFGAVVPDPEVGSMPTQYFES